MKTESIRLYGVFGTGEGQISGQSVRDQLDLIGSADVLEIHIASKGGDAWQGLEVYGALRDFPARKIVYIDAYAISVASWVAMVGDEIHIAENGVFMYHAGKLRPDFSTEEELLQHAAALHQMDEQMADIYSARTGIPLAQIVAEMKAVTWLKAKDAVARGFAHKLMPNRTLVATLDVSDFNNVPEWVQEEFQAGLINQVEEIPVADPVVPPVVTPVVETPAPVVPAAEVPIVAPPVANVVDVPAIQNAATIKERARIRDLTAVCTMAGCPEMVNEFIDKGFDADAVQKQLFPVVCANRKPIGESGGTPAETIVNQVDAKLEAEWESSKTTIENMGVPKEVYFASRRQDVAAVK